MINLQSLSVFVTERLTLAAQEIFKAVEVTVTEYHEEISRSRQENELLKRRLLEAGIDFYTESPLDASGSASSGSLLEAIKEESDDNVILDNQSPENEAKNLVQKIMLTKPGGEVVIREYSQTQSLSDSTRRKMVNILTADMTDNYGTSPPRHIREMYARGIVALFPSLRDPCSKNGYEHFYDPQTGQGYLSWRIKNIQRNRSTSESRQLTSRPLNGGPTAEREASSGSEMTLTEEQCQEAISLMNHTSEEETVRVKMKETFPHRRKMVQDPHRCTDILSKFPRFLDVKGLIEQDFVRLFGEKTSTRFLERWPILFKQKVIHQSKSLHASQDLQQLIDAAELPFTEPERDNAEWDSDLASVLLLLHLIPPSPQGRKRPGKMSACQAEKHLVVFKMAGTSIQEHLDGSEESTQPYLLAVGTKKNSIHGYFIVVDKKAIPCKSVSSLGAFDELFKAHFVFGVSYNKVLHNMYTFIQTTVFQIDVGKVKESPRVAELRARFIN